MTRIHECAMTLTLGCYLYTQINDLMLRCSDTDRCDCALDTDHSEGEKGVR